MRPSIGRRRRMRCGSILVRTARKTITRSHFTRPLVRQRDSCLHAIRRCSRRQEGSSGALIAEGGSQQFVPSCKTFRESAGLFMHATPLSAITAMRARRDIHFSRRFATFALIITLLASVAGRMSSLGLFLFPIDILYLSKERVPAAILGLM